MNAQMSQYTEVIRLSDKLFIEQESVSELDVGDKLSIHHCRQTAYYHIGDHDRGHDTRSRTTKPRARISLSTGFMMDKTI